MPNYFSTTGTIDRTSAPDLLNKAIDAMFLQRNEVAGAVLGQFFDTETKDSGVERFIVVLNFSGYDQVVTIPFSHNGVWRDQLNGGDVEVSDCRLEHQRISSHWGRIYSNIVPD